MAFKIGEKVVHKATSKFRMVVTGFAVKWENNMQKTAAQEGNPQYPICEYYNDDTKKFEHGTFNADSLESLE